MPALGAADKLLPLSFPLPCGKAAQENDGFASGLQSMLITKGCQKYFFDTLRKIFFYFPSILLAFLAHNSREEAITLKKIWFLLSLCLLVALTLAGCASNADTTGSPSPSVSPTTSPMTSPSTSPSVMPDTSPSATDGTLGTTSTGTSAAAGPGITTLEEAKKASDEMEDAIEKLTEVKDAYVVALGNTALVGVKFDTQYQGTMDERMQKMILARIQTINKGITSIAVATSEQDVAAVEQLSDALENATSLSAVTTQAEELTGKLTVYKE